MTLFLRSWHTFISLEVSVKNMLTSLRAVGELQNPAIKERHWTELMTTTKVIQKGYKSNKKQNIKNILNSFSLCLIHRV